MVKKILPMVHGKIIRGGAPKISHKFVINIGAC